MRKFGIFMLLAAILTMLTACDLSYMTNPTPPDGELSATASLDEVPAPSPDDTSDASPDGSLNGDATTPANTENSSPSDPPADAPAETSPSEPYEPSDGAVLSHTFTLAGPYDVKGGYISGTSSPSVELELSRVFDLDALAEADYICRVNVSYQAAVQGDHLNLRFSLAMGGSFVLVDDYRYLDHDETSGQNHGVYAIYGNTYSATDTLSLHWDTKGITGLDGINYCKITDVTVQVEFYTEAAEEPEEEPLMEYDFLLSGSYTVRGGYISGTTTPSVSVDLSEIFNLQALAERGYICSITVHYMAEVQGDHLNLRCTLDGPAVEVSDYVYLDHNEKSTLSHTAYSIPPSHYTSFHIVHVKWDCKGVSAFDGLNECLLTNVRVEVRFS